MTKVFILQNTNFILKHLKELNQSTQKLQTAYTSPGGQFPKCKIIQAGR